MLCSTSIAVGVVLGFAAQTRADPVLDWNVLALDCIRVENTSPPLAARNLAILHLAIYDAVNSIERTHQPYLGFIEVTRPLSNDLVAGAAGFRVAGVLFPSRKPAFASLWQRQSTPAAGRPELTNSIALGFAAADALLEMRAADSAHMTITYVPSSKPGAWRRTPPFFRPPDLPQWGCLKPFALARCDQFRPPPPPALDSRRYAEDVNTVKRLGGKISVERSADETVTARFWSDFSGTVTPPGHWNQIARGIASNEGLKLAEKARLLALLNVALADAGVVCWDAKFTYNVWRPVTAIHRADEDGNPGTAQDASWQPLLVTPAFPEKGVST